MKAIFIDWHNTLSTSRFWAHSRDSRLSATGLQAFTRWTVPALNLDAIFAQVLNSADVGMRKRNPPFFRNWLEQHEVEPNEAFLLDDRVGAYRRSGMALWPVVHPSLLTHVLGEVSKFCR
jgi:hypothetical protein